MLIKKTISPKTFERKNKEIDHWFTTEKENINKTKNEIEKTWSTLADTVKRTKRDFLFM